MDRREGSQRGVDAEDCGLPLEQANVPRDVMCIVLYPRPTGLPLGILGCLNPWEGFIACLTQLLFLPGRVRLTIYRH